jgi:hypothetical protein
MGRDFLCNIFIISRYSYQLWCKKDYKGRLQKEESAIVRPILNGLFGRVRHYCMSELYSDLILLKVNRLILEATHTKSVPHLEVVHIDVAIIVLQVHTECVPQKALRGTPKVCVDVQIIEATPTATVARKQRGESACICPCPTTVSLS